MMAQQQAVHRAHRQHQGEGQEHRPHKIMNEVEAHADDGEERRRVQQLHPEIPAATRIRAAPGLRVPRVALFTAAGILRIACPC